MITDADIDFHLPANADYRHAETNFWTVLIPEERLMAVVYTVARKALGVQSCDISIYGALTPHRVETLYLDSQQHLPCPESLRAYRTVNGLSVSAKSIRDYRIDYIGYDDTELHFDFRGLMAPFDIHDPNDSPLATADISTRPAISPALCGCAAAISRLTATRRWITAGACVPRCTCPAWACNRRSLARNWDSSGSIIGTWMPPPTAPPASRMATFSTRARAMGWWMRN
jgi:hypothetical protein